MKKWRLCLTGVVLAAACLTGCQQKDPEPGEVAGYDEGEEYLSNCYQQLLLNHYFLDYG